MLRLAAAWWSTGYLMHDDHFLVVEVGTGGRTGKTTTAGALEPGWNASPSREICHPGLQMLLVTC